MNYTQIFIGIILVYEIALGLLFMNRTLPVSRGRAKIIGSIVYFVVYSAVVLLEEYVLGELVSDSYLLYITLHFCLLFIYALIFGKGTFVFKIYYSVIFLSMLLLVSFPSMIISEILLDNGIVPVDASVIIMRTLDAAFLTLVSYFLYHFRVDTFKKYPVSFYIAMLGSAITNLLSFNMLKPLFQQYSSIPYIGLISFAIEICIYFMIWQSTSEYNSRIQLELIAHQEDYQNKHMNELRNIVEEYHKLRHDTKNQFAIMDRLLSQEKYTELRNYFYNLTKDIYELDNQIETGNEIVNQVINIKYASAHQLDIPMDIHCILPEQLSIPDYELCSLLSNIIDNAIEASSKIKEPKITIKMFKKKSYLCIQVSNKIEPWQKKNALSHITTKTDSELHGLGWQIIDDIINKYNGIYSHFVEEDTYFTEIMLVD